MKENLHTITAIRFAGLLEPLGAQQREEEVDEQEHGDNEGNPDHVALL
jgi:hypothetical protein